MVAYCESGNFNKQIYKLLNLKYQSEKDRWSKDLIHSFSQELSTLPDPPDTLIISSELFHTNLTKKEELVKLYEALKVYSDEIEVVVYLRKQVDTAISLFSTMLKAGMKHDTPFYPGMAIPRRFDYLSLLNLWESVFRKNNVKPRLYDKQYLIDSDLIADFCSVVGLSEIGAHNFIYPERQNQRLSVVGQFILHYINTNIPAEMTNRTRTEIIKFIEQNYVGPSLQPKHCDCMQFQQLFEKDNIEIAKRWFGREQLFDDYQQDVEYRTFDTISPDKKRREINRLNEYLYS